VGRLACAATDIGGAAHEVVSWRQQRSLETLGMVRRRLPTMIAATLQLHTLAAPLGNTGYPHATTSMKRAELLPLLGSRRR
jgi:hypothetical protein